MVLKAKLFSTLHAKYLTSKLKPSTFLRVKQLSVASTRGSLLFILTEM